MILIGFVSFFLTSSFNSSLHAQAFQKGSLLLSVSEGGTSADYSTSDISNSKPVQVHKSQIEGERDPLIIEYGISKKWGLGLTSGADIFEVDPSKFYGFKRYDNKPVEVTTSELTFDGNYHFLVNKRLDLAAFVSLGFFSVSFEGNGVGDDETSYTYSANGNIIRTGVRVRYYFFKRFGAFGMLSSYSGNCSPKDFKENTVANNYSTKISGNAVEIGLCYRFLK